MTHKNMIISTANKVVEAGYKLSLNEQRIVLACIAQVDSTKELLVTDRFELTAKDFANLFGISEDRAYSELKEVAEKLFNRYVIIDNPDPKYPTLKYTKTRWISAIDYIPDEGKLVLFFAFKMLPYLGQLKQQFTSYKLEYIGKMTCIYGVRLYELLMQWKSTGKREVGIEWLKQQFQLDDSYERMDNLKARVIDPAVADINKHSNYEVSWTQRKTGRRVTHLTFTFSEKLAVKPKKIKTIKEEEIMGITKSEIEKLARPGETYQQAALRIARENLKGGKS